MDVCMVVLFMFCFKCLSWMTIFCVWSKHVKWGIPSPSPLSNFLSCVMKLSSVHAGSLPFLSWTYFPFFRLLEPNSNQIFTSLLHYIHVSLYYFINCIYYFVRIWGSCMRGEFHVNKFLSVRGTAGFRVCHWSTLLGAPLRPDDASGLPDHQYHAM